MLQPLSPASGTYRVILNHWNYSQILNQMSRKILGGAQYLIQYDFINLYRVRKRKQIITQSSRETFKVCTKKLLWK